MHECVLREPRARSSQGLKTVDCKSEARFGVCVYVYVPLCVSLCVYILDVCPGIKRATGHMCHMVREGAT